MNEINGAKRPVKIEKGKKPIRIQNEGISKKRKTKINIKILSICCIIILVMLILGYFLYKPNIEKIKTSVVKIEVYDKDGEIVSTGSGFCAFDKHYIVTNFHVIDGAYKIKMVCDDNTKMDINNVLIFNMNSDLAILESSYELTPLKIVNSSKIKIGDKIITIGSPEGQLNTISTGIISNTEVDKHIMITAPISPGSSGGVLLNSKYRVIGITNATYASEESQNLNYAIDISLLNSLYEQYKNKDYYELSSNNIKEKDISNAKSYHPTSIKNFYEQTNELYRFEKNLSSGWKSIYNSFSSEQKNITIDLIEEIENYKYKSVNIATDVKKWNTTEFFMNLEIVEKYQYAIIITDLDSCNSREEKLEKIKKYPVNAAQKSLILYLLGDYNWNEISFQNKEDIFNYFDPKYNTSELGAILENLGYIVRYENDGKLTAWW